jgi:hypothetical protein
LCCACAQLVQCTAAQTAHCATCASCATPSLTRPNLFEPCPVCRCFKLTRTVCNSRRSLRVAVGSSASAVADHQLLRHLSATTHEPQHSRGNHRSALPQRGHWEAHGKPLGVIWPPQPRWRGSHTRPHPPPPCPPIMKTNPGSRLSHGGALYRRAITERQRREPRDAREPGRPGAASTIPAIAHMRPAGVKWSPDPSSWSSQR